MTSELTSFDVEKKLAETHFVGQVCKVGKESEKRQWTTVTSLRKCAMIARCVTVPEESLVPIPPKLDAGEAVAIVSNYLPAFGALYHGSEKHKKRFSRSALIKKKVLVTGGGTNAAEAVVKLAVLGGASKVFLLNSNKALTACHVGSHKVVSLSDDPDEWISRVRGSVDVIIDLEYPKNFDAIKSVMSMSRNGRLVTCRSSEKAEDHGWAANIKQAATQASLLMVPGATIYDFDSICENNCGEVVVSFFIRPVLL